MKIRTDLITFLSIFVLMSAGALVAVHGADKVDAPKLFKKSGCVGCHSIMALDIKVDKSLKTDDDAEEAEAAADNDDREPPDLSGVGLEHDAKWISNYLRKKEELHGHKHKKRFKGSDEERRALAMWLASQKKEMKGEDKKMEKEPMEKEHKKNDKDDDEGQGSEG